MQSYIICKVYIIHGAIQCTVTGPRKYVYDNTFGVKKVQPSKVESYLGSECMNRLVTTRSDIRIRLRGLAY